MKYLLITCFLLLSCNSRSGIQSNNINSVRTAESIVIDSHTSQNSLNWAGLYQGETPCADCEGIFTTLFIQQATNAQQNSDVAYIYQLRQQYQGKSDAYFYEQGSFIWQENGSIITLLPNTDGLKEGSLNPSRYFKVVENAVLMLNTLGEEITNSGFAEKYRLKKLVDAKNFPAFIDIDLNDDYGSAYQISPLKWIQDDKNLLHIIEWNMDDGYVLAQNDVQNVYNPGKFTRIDWVDLAKAQLPYQWAFCMISYKDESIEAARGNSFANKDSLLTGCNGFPFTRLMVKE